MVLTPNGDFDANTVGNYKHFSVFKKEHLGLGGSWQKSLFGLQRRNFWPKNHAGLGQWTCTQGMPTLVNLRNLTKYKLKLSSREHSEQEHYFSLQIPWEREHLIIQQTLVATSADKVIAVF